MDKYALLIFLILTCCVGKNIQNPKDMTEKKEFSLDKNLEKEIQSIILQVNEKSDYIKLSFYKDNNVYYLSILDDIRPPLFIDTCCYVGHMKYQNKWLIFTNKESDSIIYKYVNKKNLTSNLNELYIDDTYLPIYEPTVRIFIIKNDDLKHIKTVQE